MSVTDHDSHASAAADGAAGAHAGDHGHDAHGHAADTLGSIDWTMWGVGVLGVVVALIVVAGFVAATGFVFSA